MLKSVLCILSIVGGSLLAVNAQNQFANRQQQQFQQNYNPNQQQSQQQFSPNRGYDQLTPKRTNVEFSTREPPQKSHPNTSLSFPPRFDKLLVWDMELAKNMEMFSLGLFAFLTSKEFDNFMISPRSIQNLLVLVAEGASGDTFQQLKDALHLTTLDATRNYHQYNSLALKRSSADVSFGQFSAIIGDMNRPVGLEYEQIVEKIYDAEYIPVNFVDIPATLNTVNNMVATNTNGQIREAITRDDLLKAQLILISGVHFQGNWKSVFNKSFTKREAFKDSNDEQTIGEVNMMFQRGSFPFAAVKEFGSYIVELPYGASNADPLSASNDDQISMIVVLPRKGLQLDEAINNIYKYGFDKVLLELKRAKEEYSDDEVEVYLPRFEVETSINLVPTLQRLGIVDLFDQSRANLEKINKSYFVSSVLHKTKIRVDEKGTEASAITSSIFANKATPPKFHANRPFLYFIVDKPTRLILFSGVYQVPSVY